jgi:acetoin utilization deacetylase AcuC-like enzyme
MANDLAGRIRRWLRGSVHAWYHPSYRLPLASAVGAPMSPRRADDALTWALDAGIVAPDCVHEPAEIPWEDAGLVHTESYLASLDDKAVIARILGSDEGRIPVPELLETWRRATGGTVEATRHVLQHGGRAVNLLGGFHHAEPSRGGGFCALNDVAIAVACARRDGARGMIGVIDLDAHPPDGIVACLGADDLVMVRSIAVDSHWEVEPGTGAQVRDDRIPPRSGDTVYLAALDRLLEDWLPCELVFYLAGADPLLDDPLGGLCVSEEGLRERDRRVLAAIGRTPAVILPAGGYRDRSWRVLAGTLALAAGSDRPVPPDFDPVQRRTRRVMATLDPTQLGATELLTEEELLGSLGAAPRTGEARFLGYYTRHGLEHALGAYGYLTTLRRLGFTDLRIELSAGGSGPDRMQVTTALPATGRERKTLVDLAASLRLLELPASPAPPESAPFRVLFVEWLELKDPRATFTQRRPKLPGQQLPGLGLADETMQLLVRAAERLDLCGVSFVPSHFHVAWMSRERFVVVDPVARGQLRALVQILSDLPLAEASQLLGGPGLPTESGEPIRWKPVEMVIPAHPELVRWLEEGENEAKAAEEAVLDRVIAR